MERQSVSSQNPGERQRSTSPAAPASARSLSSSSYPRGQSGSTAHTSSSGSGEVQQHGSDRSKGAMQPLTHEAAGIGPSRVSSHQQQQHQQRDSARARGDARQAGGGSRCAAAGAPAAASSLFDTTVLTTSSSSTPSGEAGRAMAHLLDSVASSTSPTSSFTPPQAAAWQSPEAGTTREQRRRPSPQQLPSGEAETTSARKLHKKVQMEEGGFSDILGESPVWTHTPPPPTQQQRQQPSFHQQPTHVHHSPPRRSSPPPASAAAAAYRPISMDAESGTPNSDNAGDTSSMFNASSVYSRDDQRFAAATHSFTSAHGSSNWASPTEVLQLRAIFQEVTGRYQREQTRLQEELAKAQAECSAYADERSRVQQLRKAYTEGLAQCAQAKQHEARWTEERALQQVQLEKLMVENQRLQLFIAKRQKLHASGHGSSALFVPTESQERVLAAVQGVTAAVSASAATAGSRGQLETPPRSPVPYSSGAAAVGMLHPSAAQQPTHHDSSVRQSRTTPSPARHSNAAAFQGTPFTFVSSETTPTPPPPPQQRPQHDRAPLQPETGDSGSSGEADHTQLPGGSAQTNSGAAAALSPSTNDTASSALSLSPTPLHQPPLPSQGPTSQSDGERGAPQRTASRGRDEEREAGASGAAAAGDATRRRRSSSMLTPSPSASEVTSATSGSRRAGLFATGTTTAAGGAGAGTDGQDHSQAFLSYSGQSEGEAEGHDTNDDPSYARGVNDISSSTSRGSHLSASAALAMGGLLDAHGRLQQRSTQAAEEMSSSPLITSGSLVGGHLASTAATRDGARATTATAASPAPTNATRTPVNVAGATTTTTTTTTTTPSLTDSTAAALQKKLRAASSSSSASTWSLQYLYQLPRTPAEALEEEVRMIKEIHRLTEENAAVTARWEHALALKEMDADQREHQLLRLAQEHEQARRTAAQWELTARQLQTEVASMAAQLDDARDALASVLDVSRQQQAQAQARLVAAEAQSRTALTAAREETMVKWAVLRRSFLDLMHQQKKKEEGCSSSSSSSSMRSGEAEAEAAQKATEELRTELHRARAAQVALEDQQHAVMTESKARITHLENALVRTVDTLEAVKADRSRAVQRIDELEAEVERLREAAGAREACMQTMEERLRLATGELTLQQEQLAEASLWQARAVSTEEDLATQRAFYEKEINVYKTAACAMQDGHHREMEKVVRRYEKLVVRFEAMKMQLVTALSDGVACSGGITGTARSKRSAPNSAQNSPNAAATTEKDSGTNRDEAFILSETTAASPTAKLACDSVATLRSSVEATDRVARSLNRAAASLPRS